MFRPQIECRRGFLSLDTAGPEKVAAQEMCQSGSKDSVAGTGEKVPTSEIAALGVCCVIFDKHHEKPVECDASNRCRERPRS